MSDEAQLMAWATVAMPGLQALLAFSTLALVVIAIDDWRARRRS